MIKENNLNIQPEKEKTVMDPEKIKSYYFDSLQEELKRHFNNIYKGSPKFKDERRRLEEISDRDDPPAFIDRVRKPREDYTLPGHQTLWLIVDFDDVINKTSTYNKELGEYICQAAGIAPEIFDQLYEESKIADKEGERIFRFSNLITELKKITPDKEKIDELLVNLPEELDPQKYVDQAVKRALLALRSEETQYKYVRISILTYGDIEYQRGRIGRTDIDDIVDDIIYTEGQKGDLVNKLLEKDYNLKKISPPGLVTVDDSDKNVNNYKNVLPESALHIHFRHPQSKRYKEGQPIKEVISDFEKSKGNAASTIYEIAMIAMQEDLGITDKDNERREAAYKKLNDQNKYDGIRTGTYGDRHEIETNITYHQEKDGTFFRESDFRPVYLEKDAPLTHRKEKIEQEGGKPIFVGSTHKLNLKEFIEAGAE